MSLRRKNKLIHTRYRLMERFGIELAIEDMKILSQQCEDYSIKPVLLSDDGLNTYHPYNLKGQEIVFAFDWNTCCITTVYHKGWFKIVKGKWKLTGFKVKAKERRYWAKEKSFKSKFGVNVEGN